MCDFSVFLQHSDTMRNMYFFSLKRLVFYFLIKSLKQTSQRPYMFSVTLHNDFISKCFWYCCFYHFHDHILYVIHNLKDQLWNNNIFCGVVNVILICYFSSKMMKINLMWLHGTSENHHTTVLDVKTQQNETLHLRLRRGRSMQNW